MFPEISSHEWRVDADRVSLRQVSVFELIADRLVVGGQKRHLCGPQRPLVGPGGRCWDARQQFVALLPIAVEPGLVLGAENKNVDLGLSKGLRYLFRRTRIECPALKLR